MMMMTMEELTLLQWTSEDVKSSPFRLAGRQDRKDPFEMNARDDAAFSERVHKEYDGKNVY